MRPGPEELLERFGSPLHVVDADVIRARWKALRQALPARVDVHYAMKANPSLGVLALLRSLGAGVEIASQGELLAAQRVGFPGERTLYAGPAKTDAELEAAAEAGLLAIHAESHAELLRLDAIGRRRGRAVAAGVRVHVPWTASESHAIIGGSSATKFGVPEDEARARAPEWARLSGVRVRSLHVFNASNVRDAEALAAGAARTVALGAALADAGLPLEQVDVGGGLGVPYAPGETPLDAPLLGRLLAPLCERFRLVVEPGRYLVAEAGEYLCRVIDVKRCGDVTFLACDGGIHHVLRPALIGQPHPIRRADARATGPIRRYRVVGPLCTSLDSLGDHDLPATERGDVLAVGCTGAYGFTESMPHFLSHPVPAEVLLDGEAAHLLRPRREAGWHLEGQLIPEGH